MADPTLTIHDPVRRARLLKAATYASVAVALGLAAAKTWAWQATGSVSVLSSLADSLLDVLASLLTFWAVRYSLSPADPEHRFGHGKAEGLAALVQAVIISASGLYVCYEAMRRLLRPVAVERPEAGITVIAVAALVSLGLVLFQRYVRRRTGSLAITADAMHYKTDLLMNVVVAGAVAASDALGLRWLDPLVGMGVALYLVWSAWQIGAEALRVLLDHEIPDADRSRIRELAMAHPKVLGFHDLRTRHSGSGYIVQFHLELDPDTSLMETHHILDEVEQAIEQHFPGCELIVHPDPLGFAERRDLFEDASPRAEPLSRTRSRRSA